MSVRGNPMLSMFSIAAARSLPKASEEGSLKDRSVAAAAPAGAGDGVAGGFAAAETEAGAGAAGTAGVWAGARAGVEGAALLDEAPGAGFAYKQLVRCWWQRTSLPTLETMHTMKPFSSMLYDSTVLSSCKILPVAS
jgi:hypothetical protein